VTVLNGNPRRDRSTGELVKDLSEQASRLVRQEVELAKAEMAEKGKKAGAGIGMLAGAAVAGLLMLGALTAFLILALDEGMDAWLAALLVTVLWGVVAGVLALVGREKLREMGTPVPAKTVESVKEDIEWLKHPTRSEAR
jgi:tetrahydromethanopterin S-methyltransferase subunit G